jgi:single-strand DNA-binding protein
MANGLNKQMVIGYLAGDAELVHVGDKNTAKCSFRVIANTGYGDYEHTEGFNVVLWAKRAEGIAPYLAKGTRVYVEGETRTRSWEDKEGQKRYRTEVVAGEIVLLGSKNGNGKRNGDGHPDPADEPLPWDDQAPEEDIPF